MAKVPGPYMPLNGGNNVEIERGPNDPPPYSEVDPINCGSEVASIGSTALPYITDNSDRVLRARVNPPEDEAQDSSIPNVVTRGVPLASKSIDVVCPRCHQDVRTSIEKKPGLLAYLSGTVMACLCCFCGCCLIPCCVEECMQTKHTCPNCNFLIGTYRL